MSAANWNKEEKETKTSLVPVANTDVYPWTMMIHFHHTPGWVQRKVNASQ